MSNDIVKTTRDWYEKAHREFLAATTNLQDDELFWKAADDELPVAWHLWHVSRFADLVRSGWTDTDQLWHSRALSASWGLDPADLGDLETGLGMEQTVSANIKWPGGSEVLEYAESAIEAAIRASHEVDERNFHARVPIERYEVPENVILSYGNLMNRFVWHTGRHLGDVETLASIRARVPAAN